MKKRILVVDDEISIRMGIREFAEYQGYDVTGAANGREALELCRQQDFDLIIMDIMMPEMDGYEAYRRIREIKDIPALMLSAKGEEYDKLQGFEAGIDDYVVKPFSIKELMARVNVILMRHEPREEKPQGEIYEFQGLRRISHFWQSRMIILCRSCRKILCRWSFLLIIRERRQHRNRRILQMKRCLNG